MKPVDKSVLEYKEEWDHLTRLMGYWVDLENPYITFKKSYIESAWWLIQQINKKGLLYRGLKIQWYSPGSGTVLSSHEVSLGYREVQDPSVYVRFATEDDEHTSFLAWTTTPWTLVSNAAIAVGPKIEYVKAKVAKHPDHCFILAADRLEVLKDDYEVVERISGEELVGKRYRPLFSYFQAQDVDAWRVVAADFVSTGDGTGLVHIAPAFGADDYAVGQSEGLQLFNPVRPDGCFEKTVPLVGGMWFKDADKLLVRDLRDRGLLYRGETYLHNYPHDWRKGTPLMSYPVDCWFIRTTKIKDRLIALNKTIKWQPEAIGKGRFGEWLENNVDWALSRRRFWGTPLPVWVSDRDPSHIEVIGSVAELRERCGTQLPESDEDLNLHRPYVDRLTWSAPGGGTMRRVPETIDVWFDSGAMPFAQWHYPFENREAFERSFPADFISEGVDQTRGWFYTLHAIASLVMDEVSYRNCVVGGLVLDAKGEKMSKTKGNAVDPFKMIRKWGADRVRWYMMSNSPPWEDLRFSEKGISHVDSKLFGTVTNVYNFYNTYARIDGFTGEEEPIQVSQRPELDRWILSRLHSIVRLVDDAYAAYHPTKAARAIEHFVDRLSNWYVRRSRPRFWSARNAQDEHDKLAAYQTLSLCLRTISLLMAPLAPFFSEWLYQVMRNGGTESVHLETFPEADSVLIDDALESRMALAQTVASVVLGLRNKAGINIRQPLSRVLVAADTLEGRESIKRVESIILSEVNAKHADYLSEDSGLVRLQARPNFRKLGRRLGKRMPAARRAIIGLGQESLTTYEREGNIDISVQGDTISLEEGDLQVFAEGIEGWLVGREEGVTVALDTRITEALRHEGLARESISRIQNLRKQAGFQVTDRIAVEYATTEELTQAIMHHKAWIGTEVLALSFKSSFDPTGEVVEKYTFAGEELSVGLRRVEQTVG